MSPADAKPKLPAKERLKLLFDEFGSVAIGVFAALWVLTLAGVVLAVSQGWHPASAAGKVGTWAIGYFVFRLTLPFRILGTLVLTPLVARVLERLGLKRRVM